MMTSVSLILWIILAYNEFLKIKYTRVLNDFVSEEDDSSNDGSSKNYILSILNRLKTFYNYEWNLINSIFFFVTLGFLSLVANFTFLNEYNISQDF